MFLTHLAVRTLVHRPLPSNVQPCSLAERQLLLLPASRAEALRLRSFPPISTVRSSPLLAWAIHLFPFPLPGPTKSGFSTPISLPRPTPLLLKLVLPPPLGSLSSVPL